MYGRKEVVSSAMASKVLLTLSISSFSSESQTGRHDLFNFTEKDTLDNMYYLIIM